MFKYRVQGCLFYVQRWPAFDEGSQRGVVEVAFYGRFVVCAGDLWEVWGALSIRFLFDRLSISMLGPRLHVPSLMGEVGVERQVRVLSRSVFIVGFLGHVVHVLKGNPGDVVRVGGRILVFRVGMSNAIRGRNASCLLYGPYPCRLWLFCAVCLA